MFKRRKLDEPKAAEPLTATPAGNPVRSDGATPGGAAGAARPADAAPGPADTGLGVPPFRPAPPKEAPTMARTPFAPAPAPAPGASGTTPLSGGASPTAMPPRPTPMPGMGGPIRPAREGGERRTLVVGRGISVQGTVQDAERLVVEGTVEASMIHATELSIAQGGVFKGEVEVEDAEIAGTIDGTLTARGALMVRASGRVLGTARCRRLQVEDGGQITGRIEMMTDATPRPAEVRTEATA